MTPFQAARNGSVQHTVLNYFLAHFPFLVRIPNPLPDLQQRLRQVAAQPRQTYLEFRQHPFMAFSVCPTVNNPPTKISTNIDSFSTSAGIWVVWVFFSSNFGEVILVG